jgi:hypothetical protein
MTPAFHEMEPPAMPGRFRHLRCARGALGVEHPDPCDLCPVNIADRAVHQQVWPSTDSDVAGHRLEGQNRRPSRKFVLVASTDSIGTRIPFASQSEKLPNE